MRVFELPKQASPRERGRAHGEAFRGEIQSLAELRTYLTCRVGKLQSQREVLELAERHLPVLADFDESLSEELLGIAEGANATPAQIVVLNHYTDLRDIGADAPPPDDGCTIIYSKRAAVVAQTWDMHATAMPYAMMLRAGRSWLLSLTGCLGMAGVNSRGLAIAINNLHSNDARIGVVWSALVRRALRESSVSAARDVILAAPVGSGHHYLVADAISAVGIETSGELRHVIYQGDKNHYVHTNHCLDERVGERSRIPPGSTTKDRYDAMKADVRARPIRDARDAWDRLGSQEGYPRSVCTNMATPEEPHKAATCAAISIDLAGPYALAAAGFPHNVEPERFGFEAS